FPSAANRGRRHRSSVAVPLQNRPTPHARYNPTVGSEFSCLERKPKLALGRAETRTRLPRKTGYSRCPPAYSASWSSSPPQELLGFFERPSRESLERST